MEEYLRGLGINPEDIQITNIKVYATDEGLSFFTEYPDGKVTSQFSAVTSLEDMQKTISDVLVRTYEQSIESTGGTSDDQDAE